MQKKIYTTAGILFFSLLFAFNTNIYAQSEIGVKGGSTYFGFNKDISSVVYDFEMRSGIALGAYYKKKNLLGPIDLQIELLYQQKGGNYFIKTFPGENGGEYYNQPGYYGYTDKWAGYWMRKSQRFHYFSLPVLLSFSPVKFLDIYAGPEIGYLFSNSGSPHLGWEPTRFSAGLTGGAAFKIDKYTKLDIRYSNDLTRIADFGDTDIKNYGWVFTIQRALLFRKQK